MIPSIHEPACTSPIHDHGMTTFSRVASLQAALIAACVGLALVDVAAAADKPRPAAAKKADAVMSPAELRDCMAQKDKLQKDSDAAVKRKDAIGAEKAEIERQGDALEQEKTTIDRTSADAVAAYNAKIGDRDKMIEGYRARAADYNKQAEAVLAFKATYSKACENRRFDQRDLDDLQRKK